MTDLPVYATKEQMDPRWTRLTGRPLTEQQGNEATEALELAGILIRRNVNLEAGTDQEVAEKRVVAKHVSIDMVVAALAVGYEVYGKASYSTTVGGIADSATLLNPAASLIFTEAHKALFGLDRSHTPLAHFGDDPL